MTFKTSCHIDLYGDEQIVRMRIHEHLVIGLSSTRLRWCMWLIFVSVLLLYYLCFTE